MGKTVRSRRLSIAADTARMLSEIEQISKTIKLSDDRSKPPTRPVTDASLVIRGKSGLFVPRQAGRPPGEPQSRRKSSRLSRFFLSLAVLLRLYRKSDLFSQARIWYSPRPNGWPVRWHVATSRQNRRASGHVWVWRDLAFHFPPAPTVNTCRESSGRFARSEFRHGARRQTQPVRPSSSGSGVAWFKLDVSTADRPLRPRHQLGVSTDPPERARRTA